MAFQKVILSGPAGSVVINESGGIASIVSNVSAQAGGGNVKGFASVSGSVSINLSAAQLVDAGLALAAAKYPAAAAEIALLQGLVDAEMKNL